MTILLDFCRWQPGWLDIDWGSYEIYDPGVYGPSATLSRADARFAFDKLMEEKSQRLEMLAELVELNGMELDRTDAGVQGLDDWFRSQVEEDPESPGRLLGDWYSVVNDIALFLGEVMIERHPKLRWELFTAGRKNASYQEAVIMGFENSGVLNWDINLNWQVAGHGVAIVQGMRVDDDNFVGLLQVAARMA